MIGIVYIVVGCDNLDEATAMPLSAHTSREAADRSAENASDFDYAVVYDVPLVGELNGEVENPEQVRKCCNKRSENRFYAILSKIWRSERKGEA